MPKLKAIYPGSFDPITLGHLDIIKRAASIVDELLVLVSHNDQKTSRINIADRIRLIHEACETLPNIKVASHQGLTVAYAQDHGYKVLVRGLRGPSDFESELGMSQINHKLSADIETIFLMTSPEFSFIRASSVWELHNLQADTSALVPKNVSKFLKKHRKSQS